jgi:hypothetical protein
MRNQFFSISLIFCLFGPLLIGNLMVHIEKKQLKRSIKRNIISGIDQSELSQLTIAKKDLNTLLDWEHDHEFEYMGEMYDVVKRQNIGDSVVFYCWWDSEETALNKQLALTLLMEFDSNPIKQKQKQNIYKILKADYLPNYNDVLFTSIHKRYEHQHFYRKNFTSYNSSPDSPPPQYLS